ncbi:MAG: DNA-binding domain-containing protein [Rhodoferax sp.]|nr:DNA-binding domain-containing protein [Rhodoferax sp.]
MPLFSWPAPDNSANTPTLQQVQQILSHYILAPRSVNTLDATLVTASQPAQPPVTAAALVRVRQGADSAQRLGIYHHAYRARLIEVLADSFAKTYLFMGSDSFDRDAMAYAVAHPPTQRSLNRYGAEFPDYLAALYPGNPELFELAQLDWDLRTCFDGPDKPALDAASAGRDSHQAWLDRGQPLHCSVRLRHVHTNVVKLWQAIDADEEVPPAVHHDHATSLLVWRKQLQPHFQTLEPDQGLFVRHLANGASINAACAELADTATLPDPQRLGLWLRNWLQEGWLRAEP